MKRRTYLGAVGAASLAGLAGCTGLLGVDEYEATPVGVSADTRSDTGYEQTEVTDLVIDKSVDLQLWTESIKVTNYLVQHEKQVSLGPMGEKPAAVFVVLSTPAITIGDREINPVADMETERLVELIAQNYDKLEGPRHLDDKDLSVLGQTVTTSTFTADARFNGDQTIEVNLHVTEAIETEENLVVGLGVYPSDLEGMERSNIESLITSIDPSVDVGEPSGSTDGGSNGSDGGSNESDQSGDIDDVGVDLGL